MMVLLGFIVAAILFCTYKSGYYYGKHDALNSVEKELNNLQDALAEFKAQLYTVEPNTPESKAAKEIAEYYSTRGQLTKISKEQLN